jgi:ATP-dependent helicase HrpB
MVIRGASAGLAERAAGIAAVISERGLGGTGVDLSHRLEQWARDRGPRASDARQLAARWAKQAKDTAPKTGEALSDGLLLAQAYPDRIAKARGPLGQFQLASGRGVQVDPADALAREPWLAVGDLGGGEARDRVLLAAPIEEERLLEVFSDRIVREDSLEPDAKGRLRARRRLRLDRLVLAESAIDNPDPELIASALLTTVRQEGLGVLPWGEAAISLRQRAAFLRGLKASAPDLSDEALSADLEAWLKPLLGGKMALDQISPGALDNALRGLIDWPQMQALDALAPESWTAPTGTRVRIDYAAEGGPSGEARVQELFGLDRHPMLADGQIALTLVLLSPARRPIQVTRDLPGFWRGSWKAVRADLRGRYPKHPWPEDPLAEPPTTRAKPRGT